MEDFTQYEKIDLIGPGEILLTEFLEPNNISQAKFAGDLNVPASRVNDIVKGNRAITVDTAIRFSLYFKNSVGFWLNLQNNYDIEKAERSGTFESIASHIRQNPCFTDELHLG